MKYTKKGQIKGLILISDLKEAYKNYYKCYVTKISKTEFENQIMNGKIDINDYLYN